MNPPWFNAAVIAAALGCGVMAGVFFAFSIAVMRALAQLRPSCGAAAMQAINRTILNPIFLGVFLGASLACALVLALALAREAGSLWGAAGAALYLAGGFGVTLLRNVPLNNQLAAAAVESAAGADLWARYLVQWTRWNHVRTLACSAATLCLLIDLAQ